MGQTNKNNQTNILKIKFANRFLHMHKNTNTTSLKSFYCKVIWLTTEFLILFIWFISKEDDNNFDRLPNDTSKIKIEKGYIFL